MKYWLMKSEPDVFSIDDFNERNRFETTWEGVRNYQARNFMKNEMKLGDQVLFYHSNTKAIGITGLCEVSKLAYPDPTQFDSSNEYFDPKATLENPRWFMVNIRRIKKFPNIITLNDIKSHSILGKMMVARNGNRLSITPVLSDEMKVILKLSELNFK